MSVSLWVGKMCGLLRTDCLVSFVLVREKESEKLEGSEDICFQGPNK